MGRPVVYKGNRLTWNSNGELLTYDNIKYSYDINSIRTKKVVNGKTHNYVVNGTQILQEKIVEGTSTTIINYHYILNKLVGFTYNKDGKASSYIYRRNPQGDIIGIYDSLGNEVGWYAYDAYGKCYVKYKDNSSEEEKTILNTNPFRYRGYYYDNETGLYYLNARYYEPSIGRFISPDVLSILDETKGQINGLNLYMYCNNNPIMYVDPSGRFALTTIIILTLIAVGVVAGGTAAGVISYSKGYRGWELAGHIFAGAVIGGLIGAAIGYFAAPTIAGLLTSTGTIGGSLVLVGWGAAGGGIAISAIGELALVGTIAVTGISAFGASIMFSKGFGPRIGHNQYENKIWNEAIKQLGIDNKDLIRRLHNEIHKYPYADTFKKLLATLQEILGKWGK